MSLIQSSWPAVGVSDTVNDGTARNRMDTSIVTTRAGSDTTASPTHSRHPAASSDSSREVVERSRAPVTMEIPHVSKFLQEMDLTVGVCCEFRQETDRPEDPCIAP